MNAKDYTPPDTWNDEETIEADMRAFLLTDYVAHDEKVLQAFRAGWKAGARKASMNMTHWIQSVMFGHSETDQLTEKADRDGKEGKE